MSETKHMPVLVEWSLVGRTNNPYQAPETVRACISGRVYGHPRFKDGTMITTSAVKDVDWENFEAKTMNTLYQLWYPNTKWMDWLFKHDQDQWAKIKKYQIENDEDLVRVLV